MSCIAALTVCAEWVYGTFMPFMLAHNALKESDISVWIKNMGNYEWIVQGLWFPVYWRGLYIPYILGFNYSVWPSQGPLFCVISPTNTIYFFNTAMNTLFFKSVFNKFAHQLCLWTKLDLNLLHPMNTVLKFLQTHHSLNSDYTQIQKQMDNRQICVILNYNQAYNNSNSHRRKGYSEHSRPWGVPVLLYVQQYHPVDCWNWYPESANTIPST